MTIKILTAADAAVLDRVGQGVFDFDVVPALIAEFLRDPHHHLCVAIDDGVVVGFVSAVHYVHPDKHAQLWINEVSVAPSHQRQGVAKAMLSEVFSLGRQLSCTEAWVLTDEMNVPANTLYRSIGGDASRGVVMYTFPLRPLVH